MTRLHSASTTGSCIRCRSPPGWRGQGIGTLLLDFVDAELAARGISDLIVAVMIGNSDAQRLYERRGLRPAEIVLYRFGSG